MAIAINTPQDADVTYTETLGGESYKLHQVWNTRSQSWSLDVFLLDGTVVKRSAKLLPEVPLINRNKHLMPGANLFVFKRIEGGEDFVGRNNLGLNGSYVLTYQTDEESVNA